MSDFDDAIGGMVTDLLAEAGREVTYIRGRTSTAWTMRKSTQATMLIDSGNGHVVEIHPVDFIGLTSACPYSEPLKGDRIKDGADIYEVQPTSSEKVYRQISPQMMRIHTKQVK